MVTHDGTYFLSGVQSNNILKTPCSTAVTGEESLAHDLRKHLGHFIVTFFRSLENLGKKWYVSGGERKRGGMFTKCWRLVCR